VDRIRHGIQQYRSTGALLDMPLWCGLLADALEAAGDLAGCRGAVAEGLAIGTETGVRFWEAELLRIRARVSV
jgi:predicted ATPase